MGMGNSMTKGQRQGKGMACRCLLRNRWGCWGLLHVSYQGVKRGQDVGAVGMYQEIIILICRWGGERGGCRTKGVGQCTATGIDSVRVRSK